MWLEMLDPLISTFNLEILIVISSRLRIKYTSRDRLVNSVFFLFTIMSCALINDQLNSIMFVINYSMLVIGFILM